MNKKQKVAAWVTGVLFVLYLASSAYMINFSRLPILPYLLPAVGKFFPFLFAGVIIIYLLRDKR